MRYPKYTKSDWIGLFLIIIFILLGAIVMPY